MLPRITRRVFSDLAIWMLLMGVLVGLSFPPFALLLGVSAERAISMRFFLSCITAGLLVGGMSYWLACSVIQPRIRLVADGMSGVMQRIGEASRKGALPQCKSEVCSLPVDSTDTIGDCARAFNDLVKALSTAFDAERAFRSFNSALARHLEFETLCSDALRLLLSHTGACSGAVVLEQSGELVTVTSHAFPGAEHLPSNDHLRESVRLGTTTLVSLPKGLWVDAIATTLRPREVLVLPVDHNEVAFGAVVLASTQCFSPEVRRRTELLRQGLGMALNNARTHDNLQRIAALDPLTELYNRRFGEARLREEFERAERENTSLSVIMFDIDHFKKVNDTHGHIAGDKVLNRVARAVKRTFRKGDVLVRFGGEEFLAILPGAAEQDGLEVAERLRRRIKDLEIRDKESVIRVTISLGIASTEQMSIERVAELVDCADQALYKAKETGRDRVIRYSRLRRQAA